VNTATEATPGQRPPLTCTIVTRNHFHLAAGLEESLRRQDTDARFLILVADADPPTAGSPDWEWLAPDHRDWTMAAGGGDLREADPAAQVQRRRYLLAASDLGMYDWWSLAFQYTALELTCCLKSRLVNFLVEMGETEILYLDADTRLYDTVDSCLAPLARTGSAGGVLLTPHLRRSLPADGRYPSNVDLMRCGVFNAGVMGFAVTDCRAVEVREFLQWWVECTRQDCIVDPHQGLFVDQKWLDQAPALFPCVQVSRHAGLNVGYWNLHDRRVEWSPQGSATMSRFGAAAGSRAAASATASTGPGESQGFLNPMVEGQRLQVFHFSGAEPGGDEAAAGERRLSRYQNRHGLRQQPAVEVLLNQYLQSGQRHRRDHYRALAYRYAVLEDGRSIPDVWREVYRLNCLDVRRMGANPWRVLTRSANRHQVERAAQPGAMRGGRFQYQIDALHQRVSDLKGRLDRLPWRRLANATKTMSRRWWKKAG